MPKFDGEGREIINVELVSTAVTALDHGSKSSIGTSAVQLTTSSIKTIKGVIVKAATGNSGTIYIGNSDVTSGTTDATDGFELGAGAGVTVEIDNVNKVYAIGSTTGQKVYWLIV